MIVWIPELLYLGILDRMYKLISPQKLEVKKTTNKGYGVFATQPIYKFEIIEECHLLFIPPPILNDNPNFLRDYIFNHPREISAEGRVLPLGFGCIYNHSNNNNAIWQDHPHIENIFQFIAIKDIPGGEEVCTKYGDEDYWDESRSHIELF